jgi:hypothetical protein
MQIQRSLLLLAFLVGLQAGSGMAADEPTADLRGPGAKVGQVFNTHTTFQLKEAQLTVRVGDQTLSGTISVSAAEDQEIEILAVDRQKVSKFRTKHIKDESRVESTVAGNSETETKPDDLAGAVVISERRDGKWTHRLEKGEPTDKQRQALGDLPDWDDEEYIPAGKQPLGKSWDCDIASLQRLIGGIKGPSGNLKSTFARLEKYRGELCAVIESKGRLKGKQENGVGMEFDLKIVEYRTLSRGVDVKTSAEGTLVITQTAKQGDAEVKTEGKGPFTIEQTIEPKQ